MSQEQPSKEAIIPQAVQEQIDQLVSELETFRIEVSKQQKYENVWLRRIETGLGIIKWSLEKFKLQFESSPQYVFQRDIFYCCLGFNVGQEQSWDRPVVVLQNDLGNKSASHTIVAPITTFGNDLKCDGDEVTGRWYIEWQDENNQTQSRDLYYYEIPVLIEPNYTKKIWGIINLSQIRTVSKKRLKKPNVAKITNNTKAKIDRALKRLLTIS